MDTILAAIEAAADAAAKRQRQQQQAQQPPQLPQRPPQRPRTVQPIARKPAPAQPPAPVRPPEPAPHLDVLPGLQAPTPHPTGGLRGLFEDGNSLMRAIVAAEVLGPPVALRSAHNELGEQSHWSQRPNEP